jgi:hypothetical protein
VVTSEHDVLQLLGGQRHEERLHHRPVVADSRVRRTYSLWASRISTVSSCETLRL